MVGRSVASPARPFTLGQRGGGGAAPLTLVQTLAGDATKRPPGRASQRVPAPNCKRSNGRHERWCPRSGTHPPMRQMLRTEPHQAIARRPNAQVRWDTPSGPLHAFELAAAPPRAEGEAQPAAFGTAHGQILTSLPAKAQSKWRSGKPRPPHQSPTLHSQKQIADARDETQQCRAMQRDHTANRSKVGPTVCGMAVPARYIPAAPTP